MLISIKDYAQQNHITYEAVRKQVTRYREELGDHIVKDGRQQFLDEYAVAFLDERRQKNPIIIYQQSKDEQIEEMENTIKRLLAESTELNQKIAALYEEKAKTAQLLAEANANKLALEASLVEKAQLQEQLEQARREKQEVANQADIARQQITIIGEERDQAANKAKEEHDALIAMEAQKRAAEDALEAERNRPLTLRERIFGRKK